MSQHDDLIRRLCEASEGSAELSAEVWEALEVETIPAAWRVSASYMVGWRDANTRRPCLTTSLSAAWEEAERRGYTIYFVPHYHGDSKRSYSAQVVSNRAFRAATAKDKSLALCAAILAAEGER